MALDKKISQLDPIVAGSADEIPVNRSGTNYKVTAQTLTNLPKTVDQQITGSLNLSGSLQVSDHWNIAGGAFVGTPNAITATDTGVAASLTTLCTEVTTNDDNDLDIVTLANGTSGQIKHIYCVASFAGDTWKITPDTMLGGTQITFGDNSIGTGCTMVYADSEGWIVIGNNGGTIA